MDNDDINKNYCRVCGLYQSEPPWGRDGKTPSFDLCSCCGTEFGYHDVTQQAIKRSREKWLQEGASWFEPKYKPEQWDLDQQMRQIPAEFQ